MLNSRTTERTLITAPAKLVTAQKRRGVTPVRNHTIVTIVPKAYVERPAAGGGTHASPRIHWRRSHLRQYDHAVPSAKYAPGLVHQGRAGWWVSVISRQLVGRADLGEVTHDYRVELGRQPGANKSM